MEYFGVFQGPFILSRSFHFGVTLEFSDRFCAEIGRDPTSITRSIHLSVSYDQPSNTRDSITEAIDAGFQHIVLGLHAPYPENVARWVTNELINKSA